MRFTNKYFNSTLIDKKIQISKENTILTQKKADLLIAFISMAWGSSYLLMKLGLDGLGVFNLIALRFGIAFLITAPIFIKSVIKANKKSIWYGAILGFILFCIFTFLMIGLKTTTASSAGFLTSTAVVFVFILQVIITGKKPNLPITAGVLLTICGIALLTIKESLVFETGSVLCIMGAFSYACHIIITNHWTHKVDGLVLGIFQLGFASLYGLIFSVIFENPSLPQNSTEWIAVLGLAIVCSAFGFVVQPVAQQYTTPERTGLLFSLEPVFSALFGYIFLYEVLQIKGYIGAALVLCGVFVSGIKSDRMILLETDKSLKTQ